MAARKNYNGRYKTHTWSKKPIKSLTKIMDLTVVKNRAKKFFQKITIRHFLGVNAARQSKDGHTLTGLKPR